MSDCVVSTTTVICPNCGEKVIKPESDGLILRNKIVVFRASGAIAKCKKCGHEVRIPVRVIG